MSSFTGTTITPESFDVGKITFDAPPKVLSNNAKYVGLKYNGAFLEVQTPPMKAPFGVDTRQVEVGDKLTLAGSFQGRESRPHLNALFEMMNVLDNKIVSSAMENQSGWWHPKKFFSEEVARAIYSPIVRYSKDKDTGEVSMQYAPTMRMSLKRFEGKLAFDVVDSNMVDISSKFMEIVDQGRTRGAMFQAVIRATGIWISGSGYGVSWKVIKLRMNIAPQTASAYKFTVAPEEAMLMDAAATEDEDQHGEDLQRAKPSPSSAAAPPPPRMIVDSDDEAF